MTFISLLTLKRGLLLFWAVWASLVTLTNLLDALKALGVLPAGWAFASGNWPFLLETTAIYDTPLWLIAILFAGVIGWEFLTALAFWRAFGAAMATGGFAPRPALSAFGIGLGLMAAFVVADEVFIAYEVESTHLGLFMALLLSLLAVLLLPDRVEDEPFATLTH
jgi:hypothetical protein